MRLTIGVLGILSLMWFVTGEILAREARVVGVREEKTIELDGIDQLYQELDLKIINGENAGKVIGVKNGEVPLVNVTRYKIGDRVVAEKDETTDEYRIVDYVRTDALALLTIVFAGLILAITGIMGLRAFAGMAFTFWVILGIVLPQILGGRNPVFVAVLASLLIIPVSFYLTHGFNKKTTVAVVGSVCGLILTTILAYVFIDLTKLTGLSSEEAGFLAVGASHINMKGLLLAGIIIGTLGVMDDITISQAAIVEELRSRGKVQQGYELFLGAMRVGKDHIASMVNTLVLAYAGVAMPLLLIFVNNTRPISELVNYEFLAEEIVRTLIGSIGLVVVVPITTALAAYVFGKKDVKS